MITKPCPSEFDRSLILPEEDTCVVHRHAPPIPSFGAYLMPLFVKNQPEIWFSDRMQVTLVESLVESQEPSTLDKRRTNPIVSSVKTSE
jgi:hypothetical protein